MMDNNIIIKPAEGTASYDPIIDNIKDTNAQEAAINSWFKDFLKA